jgi:hypothetical protein
MSFRSAAGEEDVGAIQHDHRVDKVRQRETDVVHAVEQTERHEGPRVPRKDGEDARDQVEGDDRERKDRNPL